MIAGGPIAHPIFQPGQQRTTQSKQKTKTTTENKETAGCETCQYKTVHNKGATTAMGHVDRNRGKWECMRQIEWINSCALC
jgi:hypothetical protein